MRVTTGRNSVAKLCEAELKELWRIFEDEPIEVTIDHLLAMVYKYNQGGTFEEQALATRIEALWSAYITAKRDNNG